MDLRLLALLSRALPTFLVPNIPVQVLPSVLHEQPEVIQPALQAVIVPFDDARDMDELVKIFDADRQWFIRKPSYSIAEKIRKNMQKEDASDNKLYISVLRDQDTLVGFIIYRAGYVDYLGVSKDHRGKRYGEKLLTHAIEEMKKMGKRKVRLGMFTGNEAAHKLYTRFGFYEIDHGCSTVQFEYKINTRAVALYDVYTREA